MEKDIASLCLEKQNRVQDEITFVDRGRHRSVLESAFGTRRRMPRLTTAELTQK